MLHSFWATLYNVRDLQKCACPLSRKLILSLEYIYKHAFVNTLFSTVRTQDFLKGGVLQFVPGRDGAPALNFFLSLPQKKLSHFPRHCVWVSSYMTNQRNIQTGAGGGGGGS